MKIFLISNMYPSTADPLFGVFVKNFKNSLEQSGINFPSSSLIKGKVDSKIKKIVRYFKYYISIIKNYKKNDFDLIYVHYLSHNTPILLLTFFLFGTKKTIAVNVHGSDIINSKGKFIDKYNKKVLFKVDLIVVPSSYFKSVLISQYTGINSSKIFISPSGGINTKLFFQQKKDSNSDFIIGMVSRIDKDKGWDDFVNALKKLKANKISFRAKIAGSGAQNQELIKLINRNGLSDNIDFLGLVPHNELLHFYNSLDLFVFPSKRESESLGLVGLEAMSCGVPVIGSDIAGIKTYVRPGVNGFLFEPGNIEALYTEILKFKALSDVEKTYLCNNAISTAKEYDSRTVTIKMVKKLKSYVS